MNSIIAILLAAAALLISGFFSGAETGTYQMSRLRMRVGVEQGNLRYIMLGRCLRRPGNLMLSILAGNNLANYVLASIVTGLFVYMGYTGRRAEIYATAALTPVLFTLGELVPKNLFYLRSDRLMYAFAPFIYFFHKLFVYTGITPTLALLSRAFIRLTGASMPSNTIITAVQRHHVQTIFQETREEGVLSPVQADILTRLVSIPNVRIGNVMVPINSVAMTGINTDKASLRRQLRQWPYTRLVVYQDSYSDIAGYVNVYEALCNPGDFTDLRAFIKPLPTISASASVTGGIELMRKRSDKMLLVAAPARVKGRKPLGIVTMKDLVEELLGELAEW